MLNSVNKNPSFSTSHLINMSVVEPVVSVGKLGRALLQDKTTGKFQLQSSFLTLREQPKGQFYSYKHELHQQSLNVVKKCKFEHDFVLYQSPTE